MTALPRLPRALAISVGFHFLIVLSLAMVRVGKAKDPLSEARFVDLVSFAPSPHQAAPLPPALPPMTPSDAPALPAGSVEVAPQPPAPPVAAPPSTPLPPPTPESAKAEVPPAEPPPAPATAEAMPPLAEGVNPLPTPVTVPAPPPAVATAAPPQPLPPGVPGGDPRAAALAACRFAQQGAPVAADLLSQMFPRSLFATIPWGQGRVTVQWLPDGRVVWDVSATNARLGEALGQVHWQHFPDPATFSLPNRAVIVDVEISGGRLSYRVNPA